jgi:hypothetical protein
MKLNYTNITFANKPCTPNNQFLGVAVYVLDSDITQKVYVSLDDNLVTSANDLTGYTLSKTILSTSKYFIDCGSLIDFTNAGTNADVPEITDYEFGSEPAEFNNRFWVQDVIVGGVKVGEKFALYDKNEAAPSGDCLAKTAKWAGVTL